MKKNFVLLIAVFASLVVNAQRLDREFVTFNYMHYPPKPFPKWVKTYAVEAESSSRNVVLGGSEKRTLAIKGFEEAEKFKDADIQITFELDRVFLTSFITSKTRTEKQGDKSVSITDYFYNIKAALTGIYAIKLKDGTVVVNTGFSGNGETPKNITNAIIGDAVNFISTSNPFPSYSVAEEKLNQSKESLLEDASKNCVKKATEYFANYANNSFGYYYYNREETVATGKGKNYNYSDLDGIISTFREAAKLYNQRKYDEYAAKAEICISGWKKALTEFNPTDKKATKKDRISSKIADFLNYSIAIAYFYMNDFDKAAEFAQKGLDIDQGSFGRSLLNNIKDKQVLYEKNQERENEN